MIHAASLHPGGNSVSASEVYRLYDGRRFENTHTAPYHPTLVQTLDYASEIMNAGRSLDTIPHFDVNVDTTHAGGGSPITISSNQRRTNSSAKPKSSGRK
ncbi:hypothetical protein D9758_011711 [Tetrapyrgos nigripes]|uniref:Uncharacterized protein n=1 Tax=Tetrapyrgos nigripes TaxID=182062 RepID=A0A8H5GDC9_9AGAR|nr:hypothetical protein D9758_011711 [Tetrapyrgos nigripes]